MKNSVFILQHPLEEKRNLRTAKILELSLPDDKIHVIRSRRFNSKKFPDVMRRLTRDEKDQTLVLYPSPDAERLESLELNKCYNIIIIDGGY